MFVCCLLSSVSLLVLLYIKQHGDIRREKDIYLTPCSLIWLDCVCRMVLLVLAAKASLTLSFDCKMDDKPGLID